MDKTMEINGKSYTIIKLLGKGKGGYSYLAEDGPKQVVIKQIHHEPCAYYQFGNKLEAELHDYQRLKRIGIPMPVLLDVDPDKERIVKEYIKGPTIYDYVLQGRDTAPYIQQLQAMCRLLYAAHTNIDYFPTNFIVQDDLLYYIDYECNDYMEQWDFAHWGMQYWSKTPAFLQYVKEHSQDTEGGT